MINETKIDETISDSVNVDTSYPHKCPVCNGWGTVSFKKILCHACKGRGYIVISSIDRQKYGNARE